jgi:G:T-mismatch repair DNA endonuclease (very short patch repair protein)
LISRKNIFRNGRRFITRGADLQGNVANMVETEQIVIFNDDSIFKVASYVQTRGSIPLIWSQKPDLRWTPKISINVEQSFKSCKEHYKVLQESYGKIVN